MGFEDRAYARESGPGFFLNGPRSMVTNLMLVTAGVYLLQLIVDGTRQGPIPGPMTYLLSLKSQIFSRELLTHPWWLLNLFTYGFVHNPSDLLHIGFNMLGLWVFGRDIESKYGRREFLYLYLTATAFAGFVWAAVSAIQHDPGTVIGASGAVSAMVALFVLNFPTRTILLNFFIPVPAWLLGVAYLLLDLSSAISRSQVDNVAYVAHLGGMAFGLIYFKTGWSLASLVPRNFSWRQLKPGPKLRVHSPDDADLEETALGKEVDRILQKIQESGQDSLTSKERRTLERASRRYQQKHR